MTRAQWLADLRRVLTAMLTDSKHCRIRNKNVHDAMVEIDAIEREGAASSPPLVALETIIGHIYGITGPVSGGNEVESARLLKDRAESAESERDELKARLVHAAEQLRSWVRHHEGSPVVPINATRALIAEIYRADPQSTGGKDQT